jgi:tetratricopeptide (TPR) repeat protein
MTPADPNHRPTTPAADADQTRTFAFDPSATLAHLGPPITGTLESWPPALTRYKPLHLIGDGGMGEVYLAHDTQLDRQVAVKFARRTKADTADRVLAEARAAARLHHPGICPVFDADVSDGVPYLTMAFVQGPNLAAELKRLGPCPPEYAAKLVRSVAEAMQYAHDSGVIHRDLKPANILLTADHEPVVTDFGLAVRVDRDELADGVISGTPHYMAPEQAAGDAGNIGERTDVFALGVILFEMLTGRVPFNGTPRQVLEQVKAKPVPPVRKVRKQVPKELAGIVAKATARAPRDRFDSMGAFADALSDYLQTEQAPPPKKKSLAWVFWLVSIPVGLMLGGCLLLCGIALVLPAIQKLRNDSADAPDPETRADAAVAEGRKLEGQRKEEAAYKKYARAVELDPDHLSAREARGALALKLEKLEVALDDFTVLLRKDSNRADWHAGRGEALLWLGKVDEAEDAASLAVTIDPKLPAAHQLQAQVHLNLEQYPAAEVAATRAIRLDKDNPIHWRARAHARSMQGKEAEALADAGHAAELEKRPPTPPAPPKK